MPKYAMGWSQLLYYCKNTAIIAHYEELGSTKNGFMKSGSSKTGEKHNISLICLKHYVYCYYHYYYLPLLIKSVRGTAIVAIFGTNSL